MTRPRTLLWQDLTRDEIAAARDAGAVVAIPVGAIEQHASHLPVETDIRLSAAVTRLAAERAKVTVLVGPPLPFGFSPHHLSFAGTISLRLDTYLAVLRDVARSLATTGFRRIVFVNGHGGNSAPLRSAVTELVTDGIPAAAIDYWATQQQGWAAFLKGTVKRFGHACEFETALVMAIDNGDPSQVGRILERIADLPPRAIQPWIPPGYPDDPITEAGAAWPPIFQADDPGYFGDPQAATAESGKVILEKLVGGLARFFEDFASTPLRIGIARDRKAPLISEPLLGPPGGRL